MAVAQVGISPQASAQDAKGLRVVSDRTISGFAFPESVAYDPKAKVLYVGQFGSELKPADAKGLTVVVPDLVQSQLRLVRLAN